MPFGEDCGSGSTAISVATGNRGGTAPTEFSWANRTVSPPDPQSNQVPEPPPAAERGPSFHIPHSASSKLRANFFASKSADWLTRSRSAIRCDARAAASVAKCMAFWVYSSRVCAIQSTSPAVVKMLLSRQGTSILTAVGLVDWVAQSPEEYFEKAVHFATNVDDLAALRSGLRERVTQSALFNAKKFARNFEDALWGMWNAGPRSAAGGGSGT